LVLVVSLSVRLIVNRDVGWKDPLRRIEDMQDFFTGGVNTSLHMTAGAVIILFRIIFPISQMNK